MIVAQCTHHCTPAEVEFLGLYPPFWDGAGTGMAPVDRDITLTSLVPNQGLSLSPDTQVSVMGTGFTASTQVIANGVAVPASYFSPTEMRYTAKLSQLPAQTIAINVANYEKVSPPVNFTVLPPAVAAQRPEVTA